MIINTTEMIQRPFLYACMPGDVARYKESHVLANGARQKGPARIYRTEPVARPQKEKNI